MELMHGWFAAALSVLGLMVGSFLNVAAIRALKKEPLHNSPSHCVHCNRRLRAADLVPLFSYIALRGRCRYCGGPISPAYPIGEAAAAVLFAWAGWHFGPADPEWVPALLLASVLLVVVHTDLKAMIIPNSVVFAGVALAVLLRIFVHPLPLWNYAAAAAIAFALLYAAALASKGGMGGGDIKLYLFIGLICGIQDTLLSLFLASVLGAAFGIVLRAAGKLSRKQPIPFGPFIAIGTWLSCLYGDRWFGALL